MQSEKSRLWGTLLVALSGFGFGFLGLFNRQLTEVGLRVPHALALRFGLAAVAMWVLTFVRGELRRVSLKQALNCALLGLLFVGEAWLNFESSRRIPIALTSLLLYLFPSMVAVTSWVFFGQRLRALGVLALGLATLGIALSVGTLEGSLDSAGVLLGFGSAVVYTGYILAGAHARTPESALLSSALLMTVSAVIFFVAAMYVDVANFQTALLAPGPIAGMAFIGTVMPIPLLLLGMKSIGATRASIVSTLEPVTATVLGGAFLHEHLSGLQLLGAACVIGAVVLQALSETPGTKA